MAGFGQVIPSKVAVIGLATIYEKGVREDQGHATLSSRISIGFFELIPGFVHSGPSAGDASIYKWSLDI